MMKSTSSYFISDGTVALCFYTFCCFSLIEFAVCNKTGQLSELQANVCALKKDALRNVTNLFLNHYMLPHDIQSMTTVQYKHR